MNDTSGHGAALLDRVLDGIVTGQIQLWEVTGAILGIYDLGYRQGIASQAPRIAQAEADADRYYLAAFNPAERLEAIEARMRDAAEQLLLDVLADSQQGVEAQLRAARLRRAA